MRAIVTYENAIAVLLEAFPEMPEEFIDRRRVESTAIDGCLTQATATGPIVKARSSSGPTGGQRRSLWQP